jgi:hypothetical protein
MVPGLVCLLANRCMHMGEHYASGTGLLNCTWVLPGSRALVCKLEKALPSSRHIPSVRSIVHPRNMLPWHQALQVLVCRCACGTSLVHIMGQHMAPATDAQTGSTDYSIELALTSGLVDPVSVSAGTCHLAAIWLVLHNAVRS